MTRDQVEKAFIKAHNLRKSPKDIVFDNNRGSRYANDDVKKRLEHLNYRATIGDVIPITLNK